MNKTPRQSLDLGAVGDASPRTPLGIAIALVLAGQGILLYLCNRHTSLMAHDEGWYTTLAVGMVQRQDWLSPMWWGELIYDKTSGVHWLIATSLTIFGQSETAARLPSAIACLISAVLIYRIGCTLINQRAALLSTFCLSSIFLWTQYGQLATQDMPLVCVELICIWALLQAEQAPKYRYALGFISGLLVGIGFLVKGFMVSLPTLSLLPYLILENRRHKHLLNPGLYGGFIAGILILMLWFFQLWNAHGSLPFQQLFGILILAASDDYHGVGPFYYMWNIPSAFLPWTPLTLIGVFSLFRSTSIQRRWLLLGYPAFMMLLLQIFPTKTLYYPLQIYPFLAMYAGASLDSLVSRTNRKGLKFLTLLYASIGVLLLALTSFLLVARWLDRLPFSGVDANELSIYLSMALMIGLSWTLLLWPARIFAKRSQRLLSDRRKHQWLVALLVGPWLAIAIAASSGTIGDYNADVKAFCQTPDVAAVLDRYPVDSVINALSREEHKMWILTSFFTQQWGQHFTDISDLPIDHYGWIAPEFAETLPSQNYDEIGSIRSWKLVKKVG
jgi:4-amino-4-deoxy-L-arabinose transferase-like glycosyltransferase